jgi:oligopeptide/dipeptide ABC transporter ATP-binding protein
MASAVSESVLLRIRSADVFLGRSSFAGDRRQILRGVELDIVAGEIVGLIGETGSGKTTLARTIMGLNTLAGGEISFLNRRISALSGRALRAFRRSGEIQFVFQSPLRSLDPDMTVGSCVGEGLVVRGGISKNEIRRRTAVALEQVGLGTNLLGRRPSQISGGQCQRVAIARALVMEPKLVVFDEPVSALDLSSRNHIMRLLLDLRDQLGVAMLIISHDLTSLAGVADRVAVLYQGTIVETGPVSGLFSEPRHPYTGLLVASAPTVASGGGGFEASAQLLRPDSPPADRIATDGCAFAPRCRFATETCWRTKPMAKKVLPEWEVRCHNSESWLLQLELFSREATTQSVTAGDITTRMEAGS